MLETVVRLINATLDILNRIKKRKAVNHAAETIANGDDGHIVQQSDISYSELANKPGSDKTE